MGSQIGKCTCCKCKDCACKIITEKNGGYWAPAPVIQCRKNSSHGRYIFQDSCDCQGYNCKRQEGCTVSKICLSHTFVFAIRIWGQLESYRSEYHEGKIQFRKLVCNSPPGNWKTVLRIVSNGDGRKCCINCVQKECELKLPRGKYEFRFTADSIDGIDHCNNYLQYDMKWCPLNKGANTCKPKLPPPPQCNNLCCSTANCPECARQNEAGDCVTCPDPIPWKIIPCDSISLV